MFNDRNQAEFDNEVMILSKDLCHPNIVKLLHVEKQNSSTPYSFIVLELHQRGDLKTHLKQNILQREEFAILAETAAGGTYVVLIFNVPGLLI